jgi:hypothetical protein
LPVMYFLESYVILFITSMTFLWYIYTHVCVCVCVYIYTYYLNGIWNHSYKTWPGGSTWWPTDLEASLGRILLRASLFIFFLIKAMSFSVVFFFKKKKCSLGWPTRPTRDPGVLGQVDPQVESECGNMWRLTKRRVLHKRLRLKHR